jgi:hypothetical protein
MLTEQARSPVDGHFRTSRSDFIGKEKTLGSCSVRTPKMLSDNMHASAYSHLTRTTPPLFLSGTWGHVNSGCVNVRTSVHHCCWRIAAVCMCDTRNVSAYSFPCGRWPFECWSMLPHALSPLAAHSPRARDGEALPDCHFLHERQRDGRLSTHACSGTEQPQLKDSPSRHTTCHNIQSHDI